MRFSLVFFRALFPNWNFFDQIAYSFEIHYKMPSSRDWQKISFDQKPKIHSLFFNPELNLALVEINVIEHFAQDVQQNEDVKSLTSFKILQSIIKMNLQNIEENTRFKIVARSPEKTLDLYTWTQP